MTIASHDQVKQQGVIHLTAKDLINTSGRATDILTRPRLPKKKKKNHPLSQKSSKQSPITHPETRESSRKAEDHPSTLEDSQQNLVEDEDLIDQLLNQTNQLRVSADSSKSEAHQNQKQRRSSHTFSKKLHDLGEDLKEVAHAVSSSIDSSSSVNLINPKRNRQKEKIAKRQAAQLQAQLDAQLELANNPVIDHRQLEADAITQVCKSLNLKIVEIPPDGHCLFSAIADQLNFKNITPTHSQDEQYTYQLCRRLASDYMRDHPDEFIHYLPGQDDGLEDGLMSKTDYEIHCDQVRDSARWGGEPEILALSKCLEYSIHIVQAFQPIMKISDEEFFELRGRDALTISYHRKSYGLGEHYNSLRSASR